MNNTSLYWKYIKTYDKCSEIGRRKGSTYFYLLFANDKM